jgi:hypothetical protein
MKEWKNGRKEEKKEKRREEKRKKERKKRKEKSKQTQFTKKDDLEVPSVINTCSGYPRS